MVDTRLAVSVHILTALADARPDLLSSDWLAKGVRTNASFVRKLVVPLTAAGLVESVRGKSGGLRLAKDPKAITLAEVYRSVVDSALIAVPEKTPEKTCIISCGIGDVLRRVSAEIEHDALKTLARRTLQDVLSQVKKK